MGDQKEDDSADFRWIETPRGRRLAYVGKRQPLYYHTMAGLAEGFGMPEATAAEVGTGVKPDEAPE